MTMLTTFVFEGQPVRTVTLENGTPGFVGKDVCDRLGYTNPSKAMGDHCKGVTIRYPLQTAGGVQETRILTEPDVLRLIIASKLPSAQEFERWVFETVLPSIRRTGQFAVAPAPASDPTLLALLTKLTGEAVDSRQQLAQVSASVAVVAADADRLAARVSDVELRDQVLDAPPAGYLSLTKIKHLIGERHGLSDRVIEGVIDYGVENRLLAYVLVRNTHEDAGSRAYRAFRQGAVSELFRKFLTGVEPTGGRACRHPWLKQITFFVNKAA